MGGVSKTYITSDIHGYYTLLMEKLKTINFDFSNDKLICIGDLVDRGAENLECLSLLDESWFEATAGNHDVWCVEGLQNPHSAFYHQMRNNGGEWWYRLDSDTQEYWSYRISNIPMWKELNVDGKKILLVHADVGNDGDVNTKYTNLHLWSRMSADSEVDTTVDGWSVVIHGHTPIQAIDTEDCIKSDNFGNVWKCKDNRIYIDSGVFFSGKLNVIDLQELLK